MPCLVFCCYAREDKQFLQELKTHLKALEREKLLTLKADIDISPGTEWEPAIIHYLREADIILLLISPDFIASDYCFHEEMDRAILRHEQGTARVIPVIIRPSTWHRMPFGKLQALPKDAAPISTSSNLDIAFMNVTKGLRAIVQELSDTIAAGEKSESSWQPDLLESIFSTSNQERGAMTKHDDSSKYSVENSGSVYGQVIGGQHGQVISGQNIYISDKQKDGIRALEMGSKALLNGDYSSARKELRVAIEEIDQDRQKKEAAKARYLQALAVLGHERPRDIGIVVLETINDLLNASINLDPCNAYRMTRAIILDPALHQQACTVRLTDYDESLFVYLKRCQSDLYHQICRIFGI